MLWEREQEAGAEDQDAEELDLEQENTDALDQIQNTDEGELELDVEADGESSKLNFLSPSRNARRLEEKVNCQKYDHKPCECMKKRG